MGFEKGHRKVGGRKAGTPNRIPGKLRENISDFLEDNFESFQKTWEKASTRDRLQIYVQLLRFALPQLQNIELQSDFERMTDEELKLIIEELKQAQHEQAKSNGRP